MSKIAAIEIIPIIGPTPAAGDLDGTTDTVIVRLTDEAGRTGIGETDAPPHVVKAFLEMPTAHLWSRNVSEIGPVDPLIVGRPSLVPSAAEDQLAPAGEA